MAKRNAILTVVLFLFLMFNNSADFSVVKASDDRLNDIEPSLLFRPNTDGDIVFSSNAHGNYNLYMIAAGGHDLHEITHDPGDEINPSISPDGSHVAYAQNNEGDWNITVMDLQSQQHWNLTHCCSNEQEPDWSDWDRIAYQSDKHGNWDIMWKDAWGPESGGGSSEDMEIGGTPMDETNPSWGKYNYAALIAYVRADQNGKDVLAYDTDRREEFRVSGASGPGSQTHPMWYPGENIFPNAGPGPVIIYQPDDHGLHWQALMNQQGGALLKHQDQNPRRIPIKSASFGMSDDTLGFVTEKGEIMLFNFHSRDNPRMLDVREHRGRIKDMDWGPMSGHGGGGGLMDRMMGGGRQPGPGPAPRGGQGGGRGMMDRMRNVVGGGNQGPSQAEQQMMEEGRKMMQEQEEMQRRMMDEQRQMEEEQRQRDREREQEDRQRQNEERERRRNEDQERMKMEEERRALELKSEQDRLSIEDERRMRELENRREEMRMEREMREDQIQMEDERRQREMEDEQRRMEQQARMMEEQRRMMREETAARGQGPGPGGRGPGGPDGSFFVRGASEEQNNCMVRALGPPVVEQFNFRDPRPDEYERLNNNGCEGIPELFGQEVYSEGDRGFFGKPKSGGIKAGGPEEMLRDPTMLAMAGLVVTVGATLLQMARGK